MEAPNLAMIPSGYKARVVYSIMPENGVGDFTFVRSGDATRINKDGLIETVDSHVPRLNYDLVNGVPSECPSLLLEPQSTNLLPQSNDYSDSVWLKQQAGIASAPVVTSNYAISPDGTLNADRVVFNLNGATNSDFSQLATSLTTSAGNITNSVYIKSNTDSNYVMNFTKASGANNLITVTNKWQRFEATLNNTSTSSAFRIRLRHTESTSNYADVSIFGAQLEQQSYATSYIPTSGSTVTRSAETCNSAGNASTFNSEQGILFAEFSALANDGTYRAIYINDNAATRYVGLRYSNNANQIQAISFDGSNLGFIAHTLSNATAFSKFAVKFGATGISLYIDGSLIGSDATFTGIASNELDELLFNSNSGTQAFYGKCKDLRYYDTEGMTDTEINNLLTQLTQ